PREAHDAANKQPPGKAGKPQPRLPRRFWWILLAVLLLNYMLAQQFFAPDSVTVPYTVFKAEVQKRNVASIYSQGSSIEGRFRSAVTWPPEGERPAGPPRGRAQPAKTSDTFTTELPAFVDPGLEAFLIEHDVEISAVPIREGSPWSMVLLGFGPAILL